MAIPNGDGLRIGCGLMNIGNSCFFNATLQALFHTPSLTDWFEDNTTKCECIVCSVQNVYFSTKDNQFPRNPTELYTKLKETNTNFSKLLNRKQQDAHEFLKVLTEEMEKRRHSELSFANKFNAEVVSEIQCLNCKKVSKTNSNVGDFILEIRRKRSIQHALDSYFEYQSVEYACDTCKKKGLATKRNILLKAPDCLCIQLKRFTSSNTKIKANIQVTTNLNLSTYFGEKERSSWKYKLVAIISHTGTHINQGHYTTVAYTDNEFYKFDDSNVLKINESAVKGSNAYVLFYEPIEDPEEWSLMDVDEIDEAQTDDMTEDYLFGYMENEVKPLDSHGQGSSNINLSNKENDSDDMTEDYLFGYMENEVKPLDSHGQGSCNISLSNKENDSAQTHCLEDELSNNNFEPSTETDNIDDDDLENNENENEVNNTNYNHENVEDQRTNTDIGSSYNEVNLNANSNIAEEVLTRCVPNNESDKSGKLNGRRIVDIGFLFDQMENMGRITCKHCYIGNMTFTKETKRGLISMFHFACTTCGRKKRVDSCEYKKKDQANPNEAAVLGIVSIGLGFYHIQELLANFNIHCMSYQTFYKIEKKLQSDWWRLAKKLEEEALLEEIRLAKLIGEIDSAGNALIPIKADGSWQKRSYGTNFSSLAGCAAIIGVRTNKIIYSDVKNKYCHVCKMAQSRNSPANKHECNANYSGPSTGMETEIIVEGFKSCAEKGARFHKFIGDGDSSTYKTLRDLRLYKNPDVFIDKYDCCNHVYKNYGKKITSLEKNTKFKKSSRNLLDPLIGAKIVKGVRMAAKHWNESDITLAEKCINLERDSMNAPLHCLGIHDHCAEYFCTKTTTPEARDRVTILKNDGLYHEILSLSQHYFANKAKSLLAGFDNNVAEGFNSLIAKLLGGKRVNNALARSYKLRTSIAGVHYNSRGHSASTFQLFKYGKSLPSCLKFENARKRKVKLNVIREQQNPKRRKLNEGRTRKKKEKEDYGEGHGELDYTPSQLQLAKDTLFKQLDENRRNRDAIQIETRGQRYSARWDEIRQNLLTSSYFGRILNVKSRKSYQKIVEDILYHNVAYSNTADDNHQRLYQMEALDIFCQVNKNQSIDICGIFIDKEYSFLGASPFRLCGQDAILVVKCPVKAWKMSISAAIDKNFIPYWTKSKATGEISVNLKSHWYFEIQGQLHISGRKLAYLMIYLGPSNYKIVNVERSDKFWMEEMKEELIFFFNEALVKEINDSRDARNMKLRAYDTESQTFI